MAPHHAAVVVVAAVGCGSCAGPGSDSGSGAGEGADDPRSGSGSGAGSGSDCDSGCDSGCGCDAAADRGGRVGCESCSCCNGAAVGCGWRSARVVGMGPSLRHCGYGCCCCCCCCRCCCHSLRSCFSACATVGQITRSMRRARRNKKTSRQCDALQVHRLIDYILCVGSYLHLVYSLLS